MQMADDPNLNFGAFSQALYNQHVVSFQTSATTSGSGGLPVYPDCSSGMDNNMGMLSTTPSVIVSTSSSNIPAYSGPNLKYGGPLTGDWSLLELQLLKDGLEKYANERGIMKYIKIAATLPNKTVRDVAMRCQWLGKKVNTRRRKPEEHHSGRKIKERKDKFVEPALWGANHPVQADLRVPALLSHNAQNNLFLSGASEIDRAMEHLLQENNRLLNEIETNILTFQAQNNIDLFHQARTNINNLLQIMSRMPGMMSKMPTLRVTINENLASLVLPGLTMEQQQLLGSSHLKEKPRGW